MTSVSRDYIEGINIPWDSNPYLQNALLFLHLETIQSHANYYHPPVHYLKTETVATKT